MLETRHAQVLDDDEVRDSETSDSTLELTQQSAQGLNLGVDSVVVHTARNPADLPLQSGGLLGRIEPTALGDARCQA